MNIKTKINTKVNTKLNTKKKTKVDTKKKTKVNTKMSAQAKPRRSNRPRRDDNESSRIYNGFTNSTTGPSGGLLR